ncbi:MAG TPA: Ig-like domain-containing protein, partial [Rhizomicrobium sp.]
MSTNRAREAFNFLFQDFALPAAAQNGAPSAAGERQTQSGSWTFGSASVSGAQSGVRHIALAQGGQIFSTLDAHTLSVTQTQAATHVHHDGKLLASVDIAVRIAAAGDLLHATEAVPSTGAFVPQPIGLSANPLPAFSGHIVPAAQHQGVMPFGSGGSTPVYGQLWFGTEDLGAANGIGHIDGDGAGRVLEDSTTDGNNSEEHASVENIGLDTADGLYFLLTTDGFLRDGRITNTDHTDQSGQIQQIDQVFGTSFNADEVQALAVDPINHIVFVGLFGQTDQYTGILEVTYNPTTGAMTSPYNGATGVVTDLNHMLADDPNTGGPFSNIVGMQYDMQNGKLYYIDQTNSYPGGTGSGTTWHQTNGLYVISTSGSVGAGTQPTPTQLSLNSQFAAGDNNNYIAGFALNEAQGIIYFAADNASNSTSKLYWMPITGGTATLMNMPAGVTLGLADYNGNGSNGLTFDPNQRQLYISDNSDSQIVQLTLSADGHTFTGGNSDFMDVDKAVDNSSSTGLFFDPLPALSNITGTSTEALQGGSALIALTATPSITDPQDGVSTKLNMGFAQVVIANAQSGDQLFVNGTQSASQDGGKIGVSWNSTTHTLTMTGADSEAEYQTLLQAISFQDTGTDNSTGSHPTRTLDFIISDGTTITDQTTLNPNEKAITLTIDRAPTLTADSYTAQEGGSASGTQGTGGTGVLGNDSDKDGDAITVTALNGSGANLGSGTFTGSYGHFDLASNGSFTYTADLTGNIDAAALGSHPVDSFTYTVSDGLGGVTASTVSFMLNRAPTLAADNPATQAVEGSSLVVGVSGVLANDTDPDGDSLTVSAVNGSGPNVGASVAGTYGHITIGSNGAYTYAADNASAIDSAATGSHLTDTFAYTASDGHGGTTTTSITVTLDRAPTVAADASSSDAVELSTNAAGNVLINDSDRDGDFLTVSAVNGSGVNVGAPVAGTYGHLTLGSNGAYTYAADNSGAIDGAATGSHLNDTFAYTASDGHGGTTTTNLVITLDRAPTVLIQNETVAEGSSTSGTGGTGGTGALAGDSDRDGDPIQATKLDGNTINDTLSNFAGTYGHLTIGNDGSYSYVADNTAAIDAASTGSHPIDTFTVAVDDGHGGTTNEALNFSIDRPAIAQADTISTTESSTVSASTVSTGLLGNDADPDTGTNAGLSVTAVNGVAGNVG